MKKVVIILSVLLTTSSCGQPAEKQVAVTIDEFAVEQKENNPTTLEYEFGGNPLWYRVIEKDSLTANDSIYTSNIRPGETLAIGKIYTNYFEFLDYCAEGDYFVVNLIKDSKVYGFVAFYPLDTIVTQLQRGNLLKIRWKIDFDTPAGDDTIYFVLKIIEEIILIKK